MKNKTIELNQVDKDYLQFAKLTLSKAHKILELNFSNQLLPELKKALRNNDVNKVKFCYDRIIYFMGDKVLENKSSIGCKFLREVWQMDYNQYSRSSKPIY